MTSAACRPSLRPALISLDVELTLQRLLHGMHVPHREGRGGGSARRGALSTRLLPAVALASQVKLWVLWVKPELLLQRLQREGPRHRSRLSFR